MCASPTQCHARAVPPERAMVYCGVHVRYQFITYASCITSCTIHAHSCHHCFLRQYNRPSCHHISHVRVDLWHRSRIHRSPFRTPSHSTHPNDPILPHGPPYTHPLPPMHPYVRAFTFQLAVVIHCGSASGRATFNVGFGSVRVDRRDVLDHSSTGTAANAGTTAWYDSDAVYVDPQWGASAHWSLKCQCLDSPPVAHVRTYTRRMSASS